MHALLARIKSALGRTWLLPLAAALLSLLCVAGVHILMEASYDADAKLRFWLEQSFLLLAYTQMALICILPLWLVLLTAVRLYRRQHRVWWAWLWSLLAGGVMFVCFASLTLASIFANFDSFTRNTCIPEEMAPEHNPGLAIPEDFPFICPDHGPLPPVVQKWQKVCEARKTVHEDEPAEAPDKPTLELTAHGVGMYSIRLITPADYPDGTFHITAHEYSTGKEIKTRLQPGLKLTPAPHRGICKTAGTDSFIVDSGEAGEYYISVWQLHFTPVGSAESYCVNSRLYLMQGYSR